MISEVSIIGNGRAGRFFEQAFKTHSIHCRVYARNPQAKSDSPWPVSALKADVVLLCVSDQAIEEVSRQVPVGDYIIAHVSGAAPLDQLDDKHHHRAIFYPLMSLSAQSKVSIEEIPFCLEAQRPEDLLKLEKWVANLGASSYRINSAQRPYLHLAAVLAHNFSNHLFHLAYKTLEHQAIDFSVLKPLLKQAVQSLSAADPALLQTGPALRNDHSTIEKHLELIEDPEISEIYTLLTKSIQRKHEKKL